MHSIVLNGIDLELREIFNKKQNVNVGKNETKTINKL